MHLQGQPWGQEPPGEFLLLYDSGGTWLGTCPLGLGSIFLYIRKYFSGVTEESPWK